MPLLLGLYHKLSSRFRLPVFALYSILIFFASLFAVQSLVHVWKSQHTVIAQAVRGQSGDLWADVVIGKM